MPLGAKWKEKRIGFLEGSERSAFAFFLLIWPQVHKPFLSPFLSQPFLAAATSGNQNYLSHCISALGNLVPWCCCLKDLGSLALESLGPMGAQVIHLVLLLNPLGHWGPSDPLVFSRSSCQVLFGSVLSYFQESLCSQSVSHCSLKSCSPE